MHVHEGTAWYRILRVFLRLGLTSFGGPVAHLGYMRTECVSRQRWLDDEQFAQLLAICQMLPGPASSQLGFGIGLLRGGWRGALAAFIGFTLPSVILLFAFALAARALLRSGVDGIAGALQHGLALVAVAVVAHAVVRLARQLTPDAPRLLIAAAVAGVMLWARSPALQAAVIVAGGLLGLALCRGSALNTLRPVAVPIGRRTAWFAGSAFALLLALSLALPAATGGEPGGGGAGMAQLGAAFYRAGALVFGGGHVVLPLLEVSLVDSGWLSSDAFFSGYGAAQAIPGPLFSVAALYGALAVTPEAQGLSVLGAATAVVAIFLPGFLLLATVLPLWQRIAALRWAPSVLAGINASVVGLLAAALYNPVITTAVRLPVDVFIAAAATMFLLRTSRSPLWAVAWCVAASVLARS